MSYLPSEAVGDAERHLAFLRALAEKYPDARKSGGRWEADIPVEQCDFGFACGTDFGGGPMVHIEWFVEFAGGTVYRRQLAGFAFAGFDAMRRDEPELAESVRAFLRRLVQ